MRKKWAVAKNGGPRLYFAELVQKKLIQHSWPCQVVEHPTAVRFLPVKGRRLGPDFTEALEIAVRIVADRYRVRARVFNHGVSLLGDYILTERGEFKCSRS